jgi:transcriptional regulator with XRE-family HTH domain
MNIFENEIDVMLQNNIENVIVAIMKSRKKANMTQEELSEKSGVSRTTISRIETFNLTTPDLRTLMQLCQPFGIELKIEIISDQREG